MDGRVRGLKACNKTGRRGGDQEAGESQMKPSGRLKWAGKGEVWGSGGGIVGSRKRPLAQEAQSGPRLMRERPGLE